MVDVDARLAEIAARWSAAQRAADDAEDLEPKGPTVMQMYWRALEDVPWLLAVLKEQAGQIERLQREATADAVARSGGEPHV